MFFFYEKKTRFVALDKLYMWFFLFAPYVSGFVPHRGERILAIQPRRCFEIVSEPYSAIMTIQLVLRIIYVLNSGTVYVTYMAKLSSDVIADNAPYLIVKCFQFSICTFVIYITDLSNSRQVFVRLSNR